MPAHTLARCRLRLDLNLLKTAAETRPVQAAIQGLRVPTPADDHQLASLMFHAYLGTTDYEGESEADALAEIQRTLGGRYGPFNWTASRVIERENNILVSAALLTRFGNAPMVAYLMTRPDFKRRGLAHACLESAVNQLVLDGERAVRLAVSIANAEAMALYRQLGFVVEE